MLRLSLLSPISSIPMIKVQIVAQRYRFAATTYKNHSSRKRTIPTPNPRLPSRPYVTTTSLALPTMLNECCFFFHVAATVFREGHTHVRRNRVKCKPASLRFEVSGDFYIRRAKRTQAESGSASR